MTNDRNGTNHPEFNVDELMQKIREEVANRPREPQVKQITTYKPEISNSTPTFHHNIFNHINTLLFNAESRAITRTKWPDNLNKFPFNLTKPFQKIALKLLNFIFKDQREVNFNVIRALKESVLLNRQLIEQVTNLKTQIDERFSTVNIHLDTVDTRLQAMEERLSAVYNRIPNIDNRWNDFNTKVNTSINDIQQRLDAANSHRQLIDEHLKTVDTHLQGTDERLGHVDTRLQTINERLGVVSIRLEDLDKRHLKNDDYLKNDLIQQKRLITMFLEEAQKRLPEPFTQEQLQTLANEEQHSLDALYVAFEDQFRGSREDILNRFRVYLPIIEEAKIGTPNLPILDVGCGRGEWLELLRESGYTARGIDINRVMLEQCRTRELEVMESDVITYLQSLPDGSLGAVTGFHIIEHLPFEVLIKLFDETIRVLSPGGLAIFETPNPENVLVGSHTFYLDPTHRNPLPSAMIKFMAESRGLCRVTTMKFHPYPENEILDASPLIERFNNYFHGPQDYAVIGYKNGEIANLKVSK
ncbi:methyltransferase domain-containing protein [Tolypothrix campylonemoides VB511288]|nr:methyltransferase domain-containing protein [Tolypothrix campylonemoides VB511288]